MDVQNMIERSGVPESSGRKSVVATVSRARLCYSVVSGLLPAASRS